MIGWLLLAEAARERRKQRERIWRERQLEEQAERQRRRAPEPEALEEGEDFITDADAQTFGKVVFQVRSGELRGQSYDQIYNLGNEVGRSVFKEAMGMLGLDMTVRREREQLNEAMHQLVGVTANVTVGERNPPYRDTHINTAQTPLTAQPAPAPAQVAAGDDDIPF